MKSKKIKRNLKEKRIRKKTNQKPNNNRPIHHNTDFGINFDKQQEHQMRLHNVYMKVFHAETLIDCMLTLGNRSRPEDFTIQLIEIADTLHEAQTNLLHSNYGESWEVFDEVMQDDLREDIILYDEEIEAFEKELEQWTKVKHKIKYS